MYIFVVFDNSNFPLLHSVTVFKKENNVHILRGSELQKALGTLCKMQNPMSGAANV